MLTARPAGASRCRRRVAPTILKRRLIIASRKRRLNAKARWRHDGNAHARIRGRPQMSNPRNIALVLAAALLLVLFTRTANADACTVADPTGTPLNVRSEERRVGQEWRSGCAPYR